MKRLTTRNYNYELFENAIVGLDIQNSEELIMPKSLLNMVNKLQELENKIENGTLIELPCKVGDIVYVIFDKSIFEYKVDIIQILNNEICYRLQIIDENLPIYYYKSINSLSQFNVTWFADKTKAEEKLKELNK